MLPGHKDADGSGESNVSANANWYCGGLPVGIVAKVSLKLQHNFGPLNDLIVAQTLLQFLNSLLSSLHMKKLDKRSMKYSFFLDIDLEFLPNDLINFRGVNSTCISKLMLIKFFKLNAI